MIRGLVILFLLFPNIVIASSIDSVFKNNKGVKQFAQEKKTEAYDTLTGALVEHPNEASLSYNLGHLFESNEEKEKALQAYQSAAKNAVDTGLKFNALFNAARLLGELKKRDEALALYQEALNINPDSVETKTNIELLMANSGGGGGESQDQKKDQQDKGKEQDKKQDPKNDQDRKEEPKSKPTPKPFQSKELNQQDVKKILDELKRQEEGVRAKFNDKYRKETPVEKDW